MRMRLLIANNGMSATKLCLSLGGRDDIQLIGIVSDQDLESNYQYIKMVDETVRRAGPTYDNIYMNIEQLIQVAKEVRADGVLPGWGYLSEYGEFSDAVEKGGMRFMGPTADTLNRLGDKIECSVLADELEVPTIPWSGETEIKDVDDVKDAIERIGLPVMIKASLGGGGRGIRPVLKKEEIEDQWNAVRSEVEGPIFVMRLVKSARHLEVQLVGDGEKVMHLHTRDCSVQRKNQKLIEEGPATIASEDQLIQMCLDACRFGEAVGLRGLATAEFLYDTETKEYYFLEVNPRLQVEHVITEMMFGGLNLPSMLVDLSSGKKKCVDFEKLNSQPSSHVVSIRVCAEDMAKNFQPSTGNIDRIEYNPTTSHEWGYFSILRGRITGRADSQFGHLFASGSTRYESQKRLIESIHRLTIESDCTHTCKTLKSVLGSRGFTDEKHHTKWLASTFLANNPNQSQDICPIPIDLADRVLAGICWKARQAMLSQRQGLLELKSREHPPPSQGTSSIKSCFRVCTKHEGLVYTFECMVDMSGNRIFLQPSNDWKTPSLWLECHFEETALSSALMLMMPSSNGPRRSVLVRQISKQRSNFRLNIGGETHDYSDALNSSEIRAPVGGRITKIHCIGGEDIVMKGQALLDIEVMKMNVTISMPVCGSVVMKEDITEGTQCEIETLLYTLKKTETTDLTSDAETNSDEGLQTFFDSQREFVNEKTMRNEIESSKENFLREWKESMNGHMLERRISSRSNLQHCQAEDKAITKARDLATKYGTTYFNDIPRLFCEFAGCSQVKQPPVESKWFQTQIPKIGTGLWCFRTEQNQMFLLLANDVSVKGGSFGTEEAKMFVGVCQYAREHHLPLIYWSANAGARMGSPDVLKSVIRVHQNQENKNDTYIYILDQDYQKLQLKDDITARKVEIDDEIRWRVESIHGFPGIGVENLSWSGAMAREMVMTREVCFTLSYVTGRSVGIGAYLNKLGERIIQKNDSPLLLTGAGALNKLYCNNVYNGNHELGGPGVMERNGISHRIVESDQDGVIQIVRWIDGHYPKIALTLMEKEEPQVKWTSKQFQLKEYDVRNPLTSVLDRHSFFELWPLWGSSMVCGRGTIDGKRLGVIAAQCQPTVSIHQTTDPAHPKSQSVKTENPGNVLFADSSAKVARCLEDCRLENIPVVLFANIRGFSGDTTEMFRAVLTHGSNIVNSLTKDGPPVFVYIPPYGTLRGGSYVVLTPTINPKRLRLLVDPRATVGILEPSASSAFLWKKKDHQSLLDRSPENQATEKEFGQLLAVAQDTPSRCVRMVAHSSILKWEDFRKDFTQMFSVLE